MCTFFAIRHSVFIVRLFMWTFHLFLQKLPPYDAVNVTHLGFINPSL